MKIKDAKPAEERYRTFTLRLSNKTMEALDNTVESYNKAGKGTKRPKLSRQKLVEAILNQTLSNPSAEVTIDWNKH